MTTNTRNVVLLCSFDSEVNKLLMFGFGLGKRGVVPNDRMPEVRRLKQRGLPLTEIGKR